MKKTMLFIVALMATSVCFTSCGKKSDVKTTDSTQVDSLDTIDTLNTVIDSVK